jgi:hypothetical protein
MSARLSAGFPAYLFRAHIGGGAKQDADAGHHRWASERRCFSSLRSSLRFRYSFLLEPEQQGAPDLLRLGDAVSGLDLFQQSRVSRVEPK